MRRKGIYIFGGGEGDGDDCMGNFEEYMDMRLRREVTNHGIFKKEKDQPSLPPPLPTCLTLVSIYLQNIILSDLIAKLYFINESYIGLLSD